MRALGASAMYAYQLHNLQTVARDNGWTPFTSMQCHYNLLYREDEREMIPVCRQYNMAITPYSPMASGHLCRPTWESASTRGTTDKTMANKYDHDFGPGFCVWPRLPPITAHRCRKLRWHGTGRAGSRPPSWVAPNPNASTTP